ncbi:MAG: glycosyltransferase family 87 protein [Proteobacteria bacterium]|nr:glycosyltransferase family 87 protein [Pseudomonadota bacterium]
MAGGAIVVEMPQLFTAPGRIRRIAIALLIALALALAWVGLDPLGSLSGPLTSVKLGDFPAFFSLAAIAAGSEPHRLYDFALQREIQNQIWPQLQGALLPGIYPPYVALLARPLVWLGPLWGHVVWGALQLLFLILTARAITRINSRLAEYSVEILAGLLLCAPVLLGVFGGQLIAASMFIYALCFIYQGRRDLRGEIIFGSLIGLWFFKPHYALIMLMLPVIQWRVRVVATTALVATILYLLGSLVLGLDWIATWCDALTRFTPMNIIPNARQMTGLLGAVTGMPDQANSALAWAALALTTALLLRLAFAARQSFSKPIGLPKFLPLFGVTVVLATPQANFYDLGLALVAICSVLSLKTHKQLYLLGIWCGACGLASALRTVTPLPIFLILAALAYLVTLLTISLSSPPGLANRHR